MAGAGEGNKGVLTVADVQVGVVGEERGYDLTLIKDAHTIGNIELDNGKRIKATSIIDDLDIAMTRLSRSGRTNDTAKAREIDFAVAGGVH